MNFSKAAQKPLALFDNADDRFPAIAVVFQSGLGNNQGKRVEVERLPDPAQLGSDLRARHGVPDTHPGQPESL